MIPTLTRLRSAPRSYFICPGPSVGPWMPWIQVVFPSLFEAAAEELILEQVLRQVLSGPNTGVDFAE